MIIRLKLLDLHDSKLAPKCPLQHRRQQRVQSCGGLGLVALECVGLRTVVAFGRTVGRGRRPGLAKLQNYLPEG